MKITKIVAGICALSLCLGNVAFAQSGPFPGPGDNQPVGRSADRGHGQPARSEHGNNRGHDVRAPNRGHDEHASNRGHDERASNRGHDERAYHRGHDERRYDNARYDEHRGRGAGPEHAFYRGGRLSPEYRSHYYVVDDWRGHHLRRPPSGYQWVQVGGDYVLAAIATGVILSILLNSN